MIGPTDIALVVAIHLVTIPPMTTTEIIEAFDNCPTEVSIMTNMEGKIIKIKCVEE